MLRSSGSAGRTGDSGGFDLDSVSCRGLSRFEVPMDIRPSHYLRHAVSGCVLVSRLLFGDPYREGLAMRRRGRLYHQASGVFNPKCFRLTRGRAADNGFGRNSFTGWILPPVEPISNPVAAAFAATRQI